MSAPFSPNDPFPATPEDEELLFALISGELEKIPRKRLLERLKTDAALRDRYGSMIEMEAMLHHEFPRMAEFREPAPLVRRPKRRKHGGLFRQAAEENSRWIYVLAGIAAALAILAGAWALFRQDSRPVVVAAHGESYWLDGSGGRSPLVAGKPMREDSVLVTNGEGSSAKLRFPDASEIILSGDGELRFRNGKSKRLLLGQGGLEVSMSKQPPGRPAYVDTPTARIEVIGTRFMVEATAARTTVAVSHGKVRMNRLADGNSVEIPHGNMATASLDARAGLDLRPMADAVPAWNVSTAAGDRFEVLPFRAGTYDGKPIIHYGVWFRNEDAGSFGGLAAMGPESRVRVKFRVADPKAQLRVFLTCGDGQGSPLSNREIKVKASTLAEDPDGWRTLEAPVAEMEALTLRDEADRKGARITALCISTLEPGDRLELEEASIFN